MDGDGLPLIGTGIDYDTVKPIDKKRLLAFVNHYVTHTVRFLNKFAGVCEEKMSRIELQIQRLEISLNILEGKLNSVPGLDEIKGPAKSDTSGDQVSVEKTQAAAAVSEGTAIQTQSPQAQPTPEEAPPPPPPPADIPTVSKDPRFAKFFKMLNVGVPPPAVKMKMSAEGLNPDLLDTPDAPAPPQAQVQGSSESSDSDAAFSDSDE